LPLTRFRSTPFNELHSVPAALVSQRPLLSTCSLPPDVKKVSPIRQRTPQGEKIIPPIVRFPFFRKFCEERQRPVFQVCAFFPPIPPLLCDSPSFLRDVTVETRVLHQSPPRQRIPDTSKFPSRRTFSCRLIPSSTFSISKVVFSQAIPRTQEDFFSCEEDKGCFLIPLSWSRIISFLE